MPCFFSEALRRRPGVQATGGSGAVGGAALLDPPPLHRRRGREEQRLGRGDRSLACTLGRLTLRMHSRQVATSASPASPRLHSRSCTGARRVVESKTPRQWAKPHRPPRGGRDADAGSRGEGVGPRARRVGAAQNTGQADSVGRVACHARPASGGGCRLRWYQRVRARAGPGRCASQQERNRKEAQLMVAGEALASMDTGRLQREVAARAVQKEE